MSLYWFRHVNHFCGILLWSCWKLYCAWSHQATHIVCSIIIPYLVSVMFVNVIWSHFHIIILCVGEPVSSSFRVIVLASVNCLRHSWSSSALYTQEKLSTLLLSSWFYIASSSKNYPGLSLLGVSNTVRNILV